MSHSFESGERYPFQLGDDEQYGPNEPTEVDILRSAIEGHIDPDEVMPLLKAQYERAFQGRGDNGQPSDWLDAIAREQVSRTQLTSSKSI